MIPHMQIVLVLPAMLADTSRFKRDHNTSVKQALRAELVNHHKKRIPGHFKQSARAKYGYKTRKRKYKQIKLHQFRSTRDLVKTGITESQFKARYQKISVKGQATAGSVTGTMFFKWPFPVGKDSGKAGVNVEQMSSELEAFTEEERNDVLKSFTARYLKILEARLKPLVRKKILAGNPGAFGA